VNHAESRRATDFFNSLLEVYVSEYSRAQQTARICLDQMALLSITPTIRAVLSERNYGTARRQIIGESSVQAFASRR
jgi:phosphohistidine phosphatase SixA